MARPRTEIWITERSPYVRQPVVTKPTAFSVMLPDNILAQLKELQGYMRERYEKIGREYQQSLIDLIVDLLDDVTEVWMDDWRKESIEDLLDDVTPEELRKELAARRAVDTYTNKDGSPTRNFFSNPEDAQAFVDARRAKGEKVSDPYFEPQEESQ